MYMCVLMYVAQCSGEILAQIYIKIESRKVTIYYRYYMYVEFTAKTLFAFATFIYKTYTQAYTNYYDVCILELLIPPLSTICGKSIINANNNNNDEN